LIRQTLPSFLIFFKKNAYWVIFLKTRRNLHGSIDDSVINATRPDENIPGYQSNPWNGQNIIPEEVHSQTNIIGDGKFRKKIKGPFRLNK